nr:tRNA 2-thiouridine(34) synthase MnmA [Acidiferrobacter thiooxydans]
MKGHVVVALSGGVDSAVAAALLLEQGYRVTGLFMKNWEDDDRDGFCPSAEDYQSARAAALHLEIPLHAANFAQSYRDRVFARFLADCKAGLTPNPDVLCNREIKFDVFWRHAQGLGAEFMATGHYARVARCDGGLRLLAGRDPDKDQSYFLHTIDPAILPFVRFPIGDFTKAEVRERARALGLTNAERGSSSGICFIGERRFAPFLRRYLKAVPGPVYTVDGEPKGSHEGLMFYTIGQRQGLGVGGRGPPGMSPTSDWPTTPSSSPRVMATRACIDPRAARRPAIGWARRPPSLGTGSPRSVIVSRFRRCVSMPTDRPRQGSC